MTHDRGRIVLLSFVFQCDKRENQFCFDRTSDDGRQTTEAHLFRSPSPVLRPSELRPLPAWWLLQGDQTRSHPELGRQTPSRQWYSVSRHGRVGRRQACKGRRSDDRTWEQRYPPSPTGPSSSCIKQTMTNSPLSAVQPPFSDCRGVEQPGSSSGS